MYFVMPYKMFRPDLSRYDSILFNEDGVPINDVNFVQSERAEVASLLGSSMNMNENFSNPIDGVDIDTAFDTFVPKGVQSTDELITYNDYLNEKFKVSK